MRWLKNIMLSKMFGLQCGEVRDFRRKERDDELLSLYFLNNIGSVFSLRWMRCEGHVTCTGSKRSTEVYISLVRTFEGKRP
jgi:hypothetical protein